MYLEVIVRALVEFHWQIKGKSEFPVEIVRNLIEEVDFPSGIFAKLFEKGKFSIEIVWSSSKKQIGCDLSK